MGSNHVVFDKKEIGKLDKISDAEGFMEREEFLEYARKSSAVKESVEKGSGGGGKTSIGKTGKNMDRAELAFMVGFTFFNCDRSTGWADYECNRPMRGLHFRASTNHMPAAFIHNKPLCSYCSFFWKLICVPFLV